MYQIKTKSLEELQKIKNIINIVINILENNIMLLKNGNTTETQKELLNFLIGNKESVVSIISKLSNLLLKFNLLENEQDKQDNFEIDQIDLDIIKEYLSKQDDKGNVDVQ